MLITSIPLYPNIPQFATIITFLLSKKNIKIYYGFTEYREISWTQKSLREDFKWNSKEFLIKNRDHIIKYVQNEVENDFQSIQNILEANFRVD